MTQHVTVSGGGVNHTIHAILTLFTCGFWAPVWILLILVTPKKTYITTTAPVQPYPTYPDVDSRHMTE